MKYFKWVLIVSLMIATTCFTACSDPASGVNPGNSGGTGGTGGNGEGGSSPVVIYIGTKAPSVAKEVGDIVFNDGSAMPYATFTTLDETTKDAKKTSAIALIFYKGTGLNSDDAQGNTNTTTSRTLGVGIKHNKDGLEWCISSAAARTINITSIECQINNSQGNYTFTGDKNGSDNLEQIAAFLTAENGVEDDTATAEKYPSFYFAKNYSSQTGSNIIAGSDYANGWYLPSIAELYQIRVNGKGTNRVFDIDEASSALGGDGFWYVGYWSSTTRNTSEYSEYGAYPIDLSEEVCIWSSTYKGSHFNICAIREFN